MAKAHDTVANNLDMMILRPFSAWSHQHESRVTNVKDQFAEAIKDWDDLNYEVTIITIPL